MNTWQPLMQVKRLYGCKDCVQNLGSNNKFVRIDCDSQSAIFLAKKPAYHSRTKHIDVQYHFVRDMVESMKLLLEKVDTLENVVDSLTNL